MATICYEVGAVLIILQLTSWRLSIISSSFLRFSLCFTQSYPPYREKELVGEESDYEHVAKFKSLSSEDKEESPMKRIGTLTASEWEVAGMTDVTCMI